MMFVGDADPRRMHEAAMLGWRQRAYQHEQGELTRLAAVPEWSPVGVAGLRTDVFGGTQAGWGSLLAVHGASVLGARPLLVADFTGHGVSAALSSLARDAGVAGAVFPLPAALAAAGIVSGLTAQQFATALTEAIHAGQDGSRADRAIDVRVLQQLTGALGGKLSPARLAAAIAIALGQDALPGILTPGETEAIGGGLFQGEYRSQIAPSLIRLEAFVSDLARHSSSTGSAHPARSAWYTCLALQPGPRSAFTELLTSLTAHWLAVRVSATAGDGPAVIVAGADDLTRGQLEALAGACEQRGVPLTLMFRHLRQDATALIGGAATTAFMRLGNHTEADQAAAFIGRSHRFVLSGWTATRGGEHGTTRTSGYSHGTTEGRGFTAERGWSSDGMLHSATSGGSGRSREYGRNEEWSASESMSAGENWSRAQNVQRVYEYQVEPTVLQTLPEDALLIPAHGTGDVVAVECDPQIVRLPGFTTTPARAPLRDGRQSCRHPVPGRSCLTTAMHRAPGVLIPGSRTSATDRRNSCQRNSG